MNIFKLRDHYGIRNCQDRRAKWWKSERAVLAHSGRLLFVIMFTIGCIGGKTVSGYPKPSSDEDERYCSQGNDILIDPIPHMYAHFSLHFSKDSRVSSETLSRC